MTADLIVLNARIRTADPARPRAQALAARGGVILALGSDAAMRALAAPGARVIDAGGRTVLPGFQDAHIHLADGGADMVASAALWDVTTPAALVAALRDHAQGVDLPLVQGAGWQAGLFHADNLTADLLDRAVPDRPCLVYDSSYHNACLNSAALALAGIGNATPDPPNGHILRDRQGRATGMLHEDAIPWACDRLPPTTDATRDAGLRAAMRLANRHGITGVIDPRLEPHNAAAYARAELAGDLTLRVGGAALVTPGDTAAQAEDRLRALRAAHPGPDFHVHSAKLFLDGVLENRTAAMLAPYADAPGGNAPVMFAPDLLRDLAVRLDAARFQLHFHAIGDAAARAALDAVAAARAANGLWPALHQIAHLQVMAPADIPRLAALGAMANIQPLWARHDPVVPDDWMAMLGPGRLSLAYAIRSMLDAGADACLSSDWPVTTLNPLAIIETAVTRQPRAAEGAHPPFLPAERITVAQAVAGYTWQAARAAWRDGFTGRLRPGLSADLVVLDRDVLTVPARSIGATQVMLTLFKGREVHRDPGFDG